MSGGPLLLCDGSRIGFRKGSRALDPVTTQEIYEFINYLVLGVRISAEAKNYYGNRKKYRLHAGTIGRD